MASNLRLSTLFSSQFRHVNTPPHRPKWNAVSNTQSSNTVYNPTVNNSTEIRRGWDYELRRRRVRKLPPLKVKRDDEEGEEERQQRDKAPLAIEAPPGPSDRLAIDYHHDLSSRQRDQTNSLDIATYSSRRSSRALVPFKRQHDLQLIAETPRSQRPIQQEWYDDANRGQLVPYNPPLASQRSHRTSIGSVPHNQTPRDQLTVRSVTRNSQLSSMSSRLLDTSIKTNRATELRLSRDMEEHHHHCHSPDEAMPFEIRGFQLEGTALHVPSDATIRPLRNVNYRASERVKNHRIYPWSTLHGNNSRAGGSSSQNSTLVPIIELRHPSIDQPHSHHFVDMPALVLEE